MDADEKEEMLMMADNAKSALAKIIYFQYDGGNVVLDDFTVQLLTQFMPLLTDVDEACSVHELFFQQILAKNPALMKHPDLVKACIANIQKEAATRTTDEDYIIGEEGKALL